MDFGYARCNQVCHPWTKDTTHNPNQHQALLVNHQQVQHLDLNSDPIAIPTTLPSPGPALGGEHWVPCKANWMFSCNHAPRCVIIAKSAVHGYAILFLSNMVKEYREVLRILFFVHRVQIPTLGLIFSRTSMVMNQTRLLLLILHQLWLHFSPAL